MTLKHANNMKHDYSHLYLPKVFLLLILLPGLIFFHASPGEPILIGLALGEEINGLGEAILLVSSPGEVHLLQVSG